MAEVEMTFEEFQTYGQEMFQAGWKSCDDQRKARNRANQRAWKERNAGRHAEQNRQWRLRQKEVRSEEEVVARIRAIGGPRRTYKTLDQQLKDAKASARRR